jgi:hypothetical protein
MPKKITPKIAAATERQKIAAQFIFARIKTHRVKYFLHNFL